MITLLNIKLQNGNVDEKIKKDSETKWPSALKPICQEDFKLPSLQGVANFFFHRPKDESGLYAFFCLMGSLGRREKQD